MSLLEFARHLAVAVAALGLLTGAAEAASSVSEQANDGGRSRPLEAGQPQSRGSAAGEQSLAQRGDRAEYEDLYKGRSRAAFCRDYARRAVRGAEINEDRNCGYTGPRWHTGYSRHYNWCLNAPREQAERQTEARREQLRRCRIGETGEGGGFCDAYARRAVQAQRINERLGCGFTGPRWASDFDTHYDWCVNAPRHRVERASQRRQEQLVRCRQFR